MKQFLPDSYRHWNNHSRYMNDHTLLTAESLITTGSLKLLNLLPLLKRMLLEMIPEPKTLFEREFVFIGYD